MDWTFIAGERTNWRGFSDLEMQQRWSHNSVCSGKVGHFWLQQAWREKSTSFCIYIFLLSVCLEVKFSQQFFFWYKWWTLSWLYNELNFSRLMKPKSFLFFFWELFTYQQAEPVNKYSNFFFFFFFYLLWPFGYTWQFFAFYRKVSFWSS